MASFNKVVLIGNLGKDPELKSTQGGMDIINFTLATKESGGKDKPPVTEWHKIVAFGKTATNCAQYLKKGSQACVEGRLQTRKWDDKNGATHYSTEIIAQNVQFLGSGNGEKREPAIPSSDGLDTSNWGDIPF